MALLTLTDIRQAQALLKGVVIEPPTLYSPYISKAYDSTVFLKMENFQETGSFKERGAYVKLKSLPQDVLKRGVIALSAGNHAQAVAFHAHNLHIPAVIVMPLFTPPTKVGHTERWGAQVILAGNTLEEAHTVAQDIALSENLTFIHPYDDLKIIAGQATIGLEMLDSRPELDVLLVPIGGGGLCAGIAVAAKSLKPSLQIYGVEVEGYASMSHALYGTHESKKAPVTLAEGIAVKTPGKIPQAILKDYLTSILIVTEEEIERAVDLFVVKQNTVVEGAGAAGLAGLLHAPSLFSGKNVGIVVSGGNIDARLVSAIMMRGELHEGHLSLLQIKIQDIPGVLARIAGIIAHHQANILEVKHQRFSYEIPIKMAKLDIMIESRGVEHVNAIIKDIEDSGFTVNQLTEGFN
jgi:threonine dehydratase